MRSRRCSEAGFSLIELLTVISIIGMLAAIALLQMYSMKKRAYDREAQVALRMVALAEEAYYQRYEKYIACDESDCVSKLEGLSKINDGVVLNISLNGVDCVGSAYHQRGTGETFEWES